MKFHQSLAFLKTHRATFNRRCGLALLSGVMILSFAGWRAGASQEIANGNWLVRLKSWSSLDAATPSKPNTPALKADTFNPTGSVAVSGAALNFDGTNDYVNLGTGLSSAFNGTNKITIQAWVYPTAFGGLKSVISNLNISGGTPTYWMRMNNEGKMQFSLETTSGGVTVTTGAALSLNAWKHITATWDGSTIRIYVNGVPDGSQAQSGSFPAGSNTVTLGISYFDTTQEQWQGALDEVRVWNSALCEAEILARYNCELAGTETGLLAYYKFNQGMASADNSGVTTLTDSSPNGRNGTLSGFALTGATSNWVEPGGVTSGNSCVTNGNSCVTNAPPTITAVGVTRAAGVAVSNSQIATVNDAEDAENTLTVQVNDAAMATVNGVTVSNLAVSVAGVVTANVVADCAATTAMFTLKVTDSGGLTATATLTVTVTANTAPVLTYLAQNVTAGQPLTVNPSSGPSDNGSVVTIVKQSQGSFTGTVSVNNTTGVVTLGNAVPVGTHTITIRATDNCGAFNDASFTLTVACPTITVIPPAVTTATVGQPFSATFTQTGGIGTTTFSTAGALPTGVTLSAAGVLSGTPTQAGIFPITVKATDSNNCMGTGGYTLQVVRMTGSLSDPLACTGPGGLLTGTIEISNPAASAQAFTLTTTFTNYAGIPGSCVLTGAAAGATCPVTVGGLTASGNIPANTTLTVTYQAQVATVPAGTVLTASNVATLGGATLLPNPLVFSTTVNCPVVGPGQVIPSTAETSDQKAGSVLIYNVYTSGATSGNTQNTRLSITNTHPQLPAFVHLFFVSEGCSVADSYLCLTANQTASFLASDLDPGTSGYLVAVAVDGIRGCPTNFNYLIGDEYVKFSSSHAANLGAQAFSAIAGGLPACDGNSVTAQLNFDGVSYNRVPAVLALSNIGSRADGNDTLLIVNRIGGNLGIGASTLGTLFGILYDDAENGLSFSLSGNCQLRSSITNNFPRTTPRFETFIPAGRTGWLKIFNQTGAVGITGAAINFNANAASTAGAFNQGHNLHGLTLSATTSYTIPVFPPSC